MEPCGIGVASKRDHNRPGDGHNPVRNAFDFAIFDWLPAMKAKVCCSEGHLKVQVGVPVVCVV